MLLHFLRQQRHCQLQFILHLYLGNIRVSARLEGQGNGHAARRIAGGRHVHQVIDTVHVLLDHLRHRILHGLRICPGVGGGDSNRRRCNGGVLGNREFQDRQPTRNHQNDGEHPGKDWALDKEVSHTLFLIRLSVQWCRVWPRPSRQDGFFVAR
ncbi:hypothetical protein D3C75_524970 [compost metagenome]